MLRIELVAACIDSELEAMLVQLLRDAAKNAVGLRRKNVCTRLTEAIKAGGLSSVVAATAKSDHW